MIQLVTPLLLCPGLKLPIKLLSILSSLRLDKTRALQASRAITGLLGQELAREVGLVWPWRKFFPPPPLVFQSMAQFPINLVAVGGKGISMPSPSPSDASSLDFSMSFPKDKIHPSHFPVSAPG